MADNFRELLQVAAPVTTDTVSTDSRMVKGFASIMTLDRSEEIVPPEEFDVAGFMAKPTLLFNHRYWIDDRGNRRAVGVPREMFVAELVESTDENYGIRNVKTRAVVDTFPKIKAPNVSVGARGLWVRVEVTVPEVWQMVVDGELNAFSWRGLCRAGYRTNPDGTVSKILRDVDLYEVSLVNVPDNGESIFTVAKSVDGNLVFDKSTLQPLVVHCVQLEKSKFADLGSAVEYLKNHGLSYGAVKVDGASFMAKQHDLNFFDNSKMVSLELTDGVRIVAAPLKESGSSWNGTMLDGQAVEKVAKLFANKESTSMADKANETAAATSNVSAAEDKNKVTSGIVDTAKAALASEGTESKATDTAETAETVSTEDLTDAEKAEIEKTEKEEAIKGLSALVGTLVIESLQKSLPMMIEKSIDSVLKTKGILTGTPDNKETPKPAGEVMVKDAVNPGGTGTVTTGEDVVGKMAKAKKCASCGMPSAECKCGDTMEKKKGKYCSDCGSTTEKCKCADMKSKSGDATDGKMEDKQKSVVTMASSTNNQKMHAALLSLTDGFEEVQKTVKALAKTTPEDTVRDEVVPALRKEERSKGVKEDPNDCFNTIWPWTVQK